MRFQSSKRQGFTVIELVVVIVVIAVLSAVATVSYRGVQQDARDSERETDVQIIVASLERFYDENGHYPGGIEVVDTPGGVAGYFKNTLGVPVQALTAPGKSDPTILMASVHWEEERYFKHDSYTYTPFHPDLIDLSCVHHKCARYLIRYKKESDGSNVTVESRYGW